MVIFSMLEISNIAFSNTKNYNMKTKIFLLAFSCIAFFSTKAQESYKYLHVGLEATPGSGAGIIASATLDVAENVAVGPIVMLRVGLDTDFRYTSVVGYIGVGVKGEYYFDELLSLPKDFDVYAGGQAGFFFTPRSYGKDYTGIGSQPVQKSQFGLPFVAAMVGGRWHWKDKTSLFVEMTSGWAYVTGARAGFAFKF
ncbi:MAG: hypothetical protein ACI84C_000218 [Flavobacteriales bacterium]|jgi:hypothetical protein